MLVSYQLACKTYDDATQGELVKSFLEYVASEEGQAASQKSAGSAPISEELRTDVLAQLEQIGA